MVDCPLAGPAQRAPPAGRGRRAGPDLADPGRYRPPGVRGVPGDRPVHERWPSLRGRGRARPAGGRLHPRRPAAGAGRDAAGIGPGAGRGRRHARCHLHLAATAGDGGADEAHRDRPGRDAQRAGRGGGARPPHVATGRAGAAAGDRDAAQGLRPPGVRPPGRARRLGRTRGRAPGRVRVPAAGDRGRAAAAAAGAHHDAEPGGQRALPGRRRAGGAVRGGRAGPERAGRDRHRTGRAPDRSRLPAGGRGGRRPGRGAGEDRFRRLDARPLLAGVLSHRSAHPRGPRGCHRGVAGPR
jgi:hypothetical protein